MTDGYRGFFLSKKENKLFLNEFHSFHSAKFASFANYSMPMYYNSGIINEHIHTRNFLGLFDVSHMGQILITFNSNNLSKLKKYIPLDFANIKNNQCYYSFLLNEVGGIIDDIIVSKVEINNLLYLFVVYNASRKEIDEKIFIDNTDHSKVIINNSYLALQGPESYNTLSKLIKNLNKLFFMKISNFKYKDNDILISRTGYTGEDGFEISIPNIIVNEFVNELIIFDKTILCGLGCRDTLRIEAGLSLYGNELNENLTPIEAGLSWAINKQRLQMNDFNGSNNIIKQLEYGTNIKKIGIKVKSKSILRNNMEIRCEDTKIGYVTSGSYSPILKHSIGIGYIDNNNSINEKKLYILLRNKLEEIEIVNLPFIKHKYFRR